MSARNLSTYIIENFLDGAHRERLEREQRALGTLIDRYAAHLERRDYVNRQTVINGLRRRLADLLMRDVRTIAGAELADICAALSGDGKPGAAEDFRARARAFFNWCVSEARVLDANPLAGFRRPRPTRRDRVAKSNHGRALDDCELAAIWQHADPAEPFGALLRFLILSGCRRGEGAALTWDMVDEANELIIFPAMETKQGRAHVVPLTAAVQLVLLARTIAIARAKALARAAGRRAGRHEVGLVFASKKTGKKLAGWSKLLPAFRKRCGVEFGLHDLRRTVRSGMARLGVAADVAEAALGHAPTRLEAIYNRDRGLPALHSAFALWSSHVLKVTAPRRPAMQEGGKI